MHLGEHELLFSIVTNIVMKCESDVHGQALGLYTQVVMEEQKDGSKGLFFPR